MAIICNQQFTLQGQAKKINTQTNKIMQLIAEGVNGQYRTNKKFFNKHENLFGQAKLETSV